MKYVYATAYAVGALALSYPIFIIAEMLCGWVYEALIEYFPNVFHDYSPILEIDDFERVAMALTLIASAIALFAAAMIVTRLDNGRSEYVIKETEGFYRLHRILPFYYRTYALPDLVASVLVTALLSGIVIPSYNIMDIARASFLERLLVSFRELHLGLAYDTLTYPVAIVSIFILIYVFKLISGIYALSKWRASWLAYN